MPGPGSVILDLFTLAACDALLGSNSTFAGFAAYYGDLTLHLLAREGVDWDHYEGRTGFFEDERFSLNRIAGSREGAAADGSFFRDDASIR